LSVMLVCPNICCLVGGTLIMVWFCRPKKEKLNH
jgi:hypothetical protein